MRNNNYILLNEIEIFKNSYTNICVIKLQQLALFSVLTNTATNTQSLNTL
jgi:hypothetical protein